MGGALERVEVAGCPGRVACGSFESTPGHLPRVGAVATPSPRELENDDHARPGRGRVSGAVVPIRPTVPSCPHCEGRHGLRDSYGRFRRHGSPRTAREQRVRDDWRAYLAARQEAAEASTRGHLLTAAGWARGVRPSAWFSGRPPRTDRDASPELREWLRVNGRPMTWMEYRVAVVETWDVAA